MEQELRKMGAELFSTQDTVTVRGGALHGADGFIRPQRPPCGDGAGRGRVCGGRARRHRRAEAVNKSWPDFFETVRALGGKVELTDE
jgi:3-phosphoshikimate 1-carboxyvinyltransferase